MKNNYKLFKVEWGKNLQSETLRIIVVSQKYKSKSFYLRHTYLYRY